MGSHIGSCSGGCIAPMNVTGSDGRGFEEPVDIGVMAENPGLHSRPAVDAMLLAKVRMGRVGIAIVFDRERVESTLAVAFHGYLPTIQDPLLAAAGDADS